MRAVRRLFASCAAVVVATAGLVGLAQGPAGASPTGYTILFSEGGCQLASVDLSGGTTTPIGSPTPAACVYDLAFAPDGTLYGIGQSDIIHPIKGGTQTQTALTVDLVRFDLSTGTPTVVGQITPFNATLPSIAPVFPGGGLAFDQAGTMYVELVTNDPACSGNFYCLYKGSASNPGAAQFVGTSGQLEVVLTALTATCSGSLFTSLPLGTNPLGASAFQAGASSLSQRPSFAQAQQQVGARDGFPDELASVNPTTGAVTPIGLFGTGTFISGLEVDNASGILWGIGVREGDPAFSTFKIDPATGTATKQVLISLPETFVFELAIPGACPAPAIVVQPAFTG